MAERADVVQTRESNTFLCCFVAVRQFIFSDSYAIDQEQETARDNTYKGKMKNFLLLIGFMCIVSCFVFASMGYIELKSCPKSFKNPNTDNCNETSFQFKQAQNYRLAAALLFILGICSIVVYIWLIKKDNIAQHYIVRTDVVVSDITEEGLLKTPAPNLPHPRSRLHRFLYEVPGDTGTNWNDLPHYESALKLNKQADEGMHRVTSSNEVINLNGVVMESVSIQVDEDDINPPPSYSQAMLHEENYDGENSNGQNLEIDNG